MIMNFLQIRNSVRYLMKRRSYSLINIFGLAIGISACLLIIQYVRFEMSYEDFHKKSENIYRVTIDLYKGPVFIDTDCETYGVLGPSLKEQMPEVLDFVRLYGVENAEVKSGEKRFYESRLYFADSSISKIFTLRQVAGDPNTALNKPFQAIISSSMAEKYFGKTNVTGLSIDINHHSYLITAVIEDLPPNTHLKFDILISRLSLNSVKKWYTEQRWNTNNEYTYLLMAQGTDLDKFNQKLAGFSASLKDELTDERFVAQPIRDIHLYSDKKFEPEVNGDATMNYFLLAIGLFVIFIAWINYTNLSTAMVAERAKEVSVRQVLGSGRTHLMKIFVTESVIINFLAGILAIILVFQVSAFFDVVNSHPAFKFNMDFWFWCFTIGLTTTGIILSSSYPVFFLTSFPTGKVMNSKTQSSSRHYFRQSLVIVQFAVSIVLIVATISVSKQISFLRNKDLGMNLGQKLVLRIPPHDNASDSAFSISMNNLKTEFLRNPQIKDICQSTSLPGLDLNELSTTSGIWPVGSNRQEGRYTFYYFGIDARFIPMLDIVVTAGKQFAEDSPNINQVIVNEEAVKALGFTSVEKAIGEQITFYTQFKDHPSTIIGVVKNFSLRSPKESHIPIVLAYTATANYLTLELQTNQIHSGVKHIGQTWDRFFPERPLDYFFLDEQYNRQYKADQRFGVIVTLFSSLAIFIACLGLFGLSSYIILKRTKEIGIRKVNGAFATEVVTMLNKDFIKWVIIAFVIACPIAWYAMHKWLENFAYKTELSWWVFAAAGAVALVIALVTVSLQSWRAASRNPVESLRYE